MRRLFFGAAVLLVAAVTGAAPHGTMQADPSTLTKVDEAFAAATAARRLEGFLFFVADDVTTIRPDSPIISGKKAFAERWATLLNDPAMAIRWQPSVATISAGGDLGYTVGSYEVSRAGEQGKRVVGTGKYVTIWKRPADGPWKVVFDSGVQDTPASGDSKPQP